MYKLYTDGSCKGNPGPGGWAVITEHSVLVAGGRSPHTTNNEMELQAVLIACQMASIGGHILTDSNLIVGFVNRGNTCKAKNLLLLTRQIQQAVLLKGLHLSHILKSSRIPQHVLADSEAKAFADKAKNV